MEVKVGVFGNEGVGKTSLIQQFLGNEFQTSVEPTVRHNYDQTAKVTIGEQELSLTFFDTESWWDIDSENPIWGDALEKIFDGTNIAMIVYSVIDRETFEALSKHIRKMSSYCNGSPPIIVLVANKVDGDPDDRTVSSEAGINFAKEKGLVHAEVSATTTGFTEALKTALTEHLAAEYLKANPPPVVVEPITAEQIKALDVFKKYDAKSTKYDDEKLKAHRAVFEWTPDAWRANCVAVSCNNQFGLFCRRSHCRACGEIFCADCIANEFKALPEMGYLTPVKVCKRC